MPNFCPDENHSDAHDVSETRHQHSLNGLKPGPHTCHKQNLLQRHRLVGAWHRVAVPVSTLVVNAATATSKRLRCHTNHTTSFANGKPHPTFDCCVGDNSAGWQWYHSSAQWCHHAFTRRPHHRCPASPPFEEHQLFVLTGLEHRDKRLRACMLRCLLNSLCGS